MIRGWSFGLYFLIEFEDHPIQTVVLLILVVGSFIMALLALFPRLKAVVLFQYCFWATQFLFFASGGWWTNVAWELPREVHHLVMMLGESPLYVILLLQAKWK